MLLACPPYPPPPRELMTVALELKTERCMSYEEEDTCMSYEEEDTCMSAYANQGSSLKDIRGTQARGSAWRESRQPSGKWPSKRPPGFWKSSVASLPLTLSVSKGCRPAFQWVAPWIKTDLQHILTPYTLNCKRSKCARVSIVGLFCLYSRLFCLCSNRHMSHTDVRL